MSQAKTKISETRRKHCLAVHGRMHHIVQLLRDRVGGEPCSAELPEAEHVLRYLAGQAAGHPEDKIDETRTILCLDHLGISTDWLFRGSVDGLLCSLFKQSPAAKKAVKEAADKEIAEAEELLSDMEAPLYEARNLARALRMMGSSDDVNRETGAAIDTVAHQLMETLGSMIEKREKAWRLLP